MNAPVRIAWRAVVATAAMIASVAAAQVAPDAQSVSVSAQPITLAVEAPSASFLGGWELQSDAPGFGGLSGVTLRGDDLLAVTDRGDWLRLAARRDETGRLLGFGDAQLVPLRDAAGVPLSGRSADAEALAVAPGGVLMVAFEGGHRIVGYAEVGGAAIQETPGAPSEGLASNGGLEALAIGPGAAMVAVAEAPTRDEPQIAGWLFGSDDGAPRLLSIQRNDGFSPTGADVGPDGALYLLERRYRWWRGVAARVRRFDWPDDAEPATDAPLKMGLGEVLLELDELAGIDNFEAIDIAARGDGSVVATLVSDDNFSGAQRTLIAQFVLR